MRTKNGIKIMEITIKGKFDNDYEFKSLHYFTNYQDLEKYIKSFKKVNGIYDHESREITDQDVKQFELYNYHNCDFDNDFGMN